MVKKSIGALLLAALIISSAFPQPGQTQFPAGSPKDSASVKSGVLDSALAGSDQYHVVKKDVVVSEQVVIGTSIMVFIIVVMSFMNNFNPE